MGREESLRVIGQKAVDNCCKNNPGVESCNEEGIIPRGVIFEKENRDKSQKGVIVVGMNPGRALHNEKEHCKENPNFRSWENYAKEHIIPYQNYFTETRGILDSLGFKGPILWTDVVKCQSKKEYKKLPPETIRECANEYMKEEINLFPDWTIFTLGEDAYRTCTIMFSGRKVVGLHHPSGANAHFPEFKKSLMNNKKQVRRKMDSMGEDDALHLKDYLQ